MGTKVNAPIGGGGGKFEVTNRTVMNRFAYSQDIEPYTFVSLRTGHDFNGATKLGVTMSELKDSNYYEENPAHIVKVGTNKFFLIYIYQDDPSYDSMYLYARILQINGDSYTLGTALSLGYGKMDILDVSTFSICKLSDTKIVLYTAGGPKWGSSSPYQYNHVYGFTISGTTITQKNFSIGLSAATNQCVFPVLLRIDDDTFYYEGRANSSGYLGETRIGCGSCKFSTGEDDYIDYDSSPTEAEINNVVHNQVLHKGTLQEAKSLYGFNYTGAIYKYRSVDANSGAKKVSANSSRSNTYYRKVIELDSTHFLVASQYSETSKGSWMYLDVFYDNGSSISKTASLSNHFDTSGGTSRNSYIDMYKHTDGRIAIHVCGLIFIVTVSSNYSSITWVETMTGVNENGYGASASLAAFVKVDGDTYYTLDKNSLFFLYKFNSQGVSDETVIEDANGKYITTEKITVSKSGKVY